MAKSKKQWLVHSYHNPPSFVTHAQAKRLIDKYRGDYHWMDNVCHVYIPPTVDYGSVTLRGQRELDVFHLLDKQDRIDKRKRT